MDLRLVLAVDELGENPEGGLELPWLPRLGSDKRSNEASGQQPKMAGGLWASRSGGLLARQRRRQGCLRRGLEQ